MTSITRTTGATRVLATVLALFMACFALYGLTGCQTTSQTTPSGSTTPTSAMTTTSPTPEATTAPADNETGEKATNEASGALRICALKGPTALGLLSLMDKDKAQYQVEVLGQPDAVLPKVLKHEVDIACVPVNMAALLYQKANKSIRLLGTNTLDVLYLVAIGDAFSGGLKGLRGKTIYLAGKGAVPESLLRMGLAKAHVNAEDVTLSFMPDHASVVAALEQKRATLAVLPQPFLTFAMARIKGLHPIKPLSAFVDAPVVSGVYITTETALKTKREAIATFMRAAKASIDTVNRDPEAAAALAVQYDVMKPKPLVAKAIPKCQLACITGRAMKEKVSRFLKALYDHNPQSVGGALPGDDFYVDDLD